MAKYDTITKQITEDITVTISKAKGGGGNAGERLVAFLKWLSEKIVDPDYGVDAEHPAHPIAPGGKPPAGSGGTPEHPIAPGGERPTHPIAPGGKPPQVDNTLPGQQPRPDQGLPGQPPQINNDLPGAIGENADKIAKLILASCFECKVPDQGLPPSAQPKR